ncbi:hypothetical protein [Salinicola salarius]|uniref:hypothetical protein n=1 Tax=Salinicola salarius TaxID=430457 RepID=UPI000DA151EC|nr:hypothetical protein [Salinicola salarius]
MKNRIEDLRNHLFATLEALQDEEKPMEIGRAKAISDVAQTIINTAKVEIDFMEATGAGPGTDFIPGEKGRPPLPDSRGTLPKAPRR